MNLYEVVFIALVVALAIVLLQQTKWMPAIKPVGLGWLTHVAGSVIGFFITDSFKRMVVTSSLCSHITAPSAQRLDDTVVARLVQVSDNLHLTNHMHDAVMLPAAYHDVIWGKRLDVSLLQQRKISIDDIVSMVPKALCYGTLDAMRKDISEVLRVAQQGEVTAA